MRHLRAYFVVAMLAVAGFAFFLPTTLSAAVTDAEVQGLLRDCEQFVTFRQEFRTQCVTMANSTAARLRNDPDINIWQLRRYAFEGIPGSAEANQRGFITYLNEIASTVSDPDRASKARLALSQAESFVRSWTIQEQALAGVITEAERQRLLQNSQTTNSTQTSNEVKKRETKPCAVFNWTVIGCIDAGLTWFVKAILLEIVGFGLWASANLLNYAMYHGIFEFAKFAPNEIYSIWLVIRQAVSLFVFFAGLYVGFMAIIGKSEDFKRYMVFLIIFGLFVNFSYPVVKVFIDISNVVSLQIYQATLGPAVIASTPTEGAAAGSLIMQKMGLQGLVASATAANDASAGFPSQITSLPGALAAVGFVGYSAYIFFMAAFLIIMRTALLVCILVVSPILLVDTIVPALGGAAKWLRSAFLSQLFVAPVFALLLALTLKFLDVFKATGALSPSGNTLQAASQASSVVVFFNLLIMIIMLHLMLKATKATAGEIGQTITKFAGKVGGLGTGVALGAGAATVGFAGRKTLGKFGEMLGPDSKVGQMLANSKYDLRNIGMVQAGAGALGISGLGQGAKNSNKEAEDEYNKKVLETANQLEGDKADAYIRRKFTSPTGNIPFIGKYTGARPENNKAYQTLQKEDTAVLKQYASANEERRKEMMEDDKNKRFRQRFGRIDRGDMEGMHEDVKKAHEEKEAKKEANEIRNTERVSNYLAADQSTRESMYANAVAANDKKLIDQLALLNTLADKWTRRQITEAELSDLGDPALAQKILNKQSEHSAEDAVKRAKEQAAETERIANEALQRAQLSAAQAQETAAQTQARAAQVQTQSTQQMNTAIAQLTQSQTATNQNLQNLSQGITDLQQTLKTLIPTP